MRNIEELIKSFYDLKMDEYEMAINNDISLKLYNSLSKLNKGVYKNIFKYPGQINVYPKIKIMVIYIIVFHNFLLN